MQGLLDPVKYEEFKRRKIQCIVTWPKVAYEAINEQKASCKSLRPKFKLASQTKYQFGSAIFKKNMLWRLRAKSFKKKIPNPGERTAYK